MQMPKNKEGSQISCLPISREYSNHELVAGLIAREPRISAAFFDMYGTKISRLVWKLLRSDDDHDDLVNASLVQIMQSIKKLKDPQSLPKWVSIVTINTVRKEIISRQLRRRFFLDTELSEDHPTPVANPSEDISGRVYAILRTMKPENHIIFALRYIDGNTFYEIAELRECSLATAKRHGKRCKTEFMKKAKRDLVLASYIEDKENV